MAGIKITDLSALSVAEATDYLCIVDVSDTSQSPAGTTKKIELGNVGLSGTWTPTLDGVDGACDSPTLTKAQYSRVGNIVTCTIYGTVDLDFTTFNSGYFNFDYPFAPTTNNSIGACGIRTAIGQVTTFIRDNNINFESDSSSTISGAIFTAIFQYEID
jgi:hypothetical protein